LAGVSRRKVTQTPLHGPFASRDPIYAAIEPAQGKLEPPLDAAVMVRSRFLSPDLHMNGRAAERQLKRFEEAVDGRLGALREQAGINLINTRTPPRLPASSPAISIIVQIQARKTTALLLCRSETLVEFDHGSGWPTGGKTMGWLHVFPRVQVASAHRCRSRETDSEANE